VNNLRFQPEALLQHEAKTLEGFPQSEVENGKPFQGFRFFIHVFFPPVKTGGYFKETPLVFLVSIWFYP
jgi:hypothetical protein